MFAGKVVENQLMMDFPAPYWLGKETLLLCVACLSNVSGDLAKKKGF